MNKTVREAKGNQKSVSARTNQLTCKCGGLIRQNGKAKLEDYHGETIYMEEWGCRGCGHSFWYWA